MGYLDSEALSKWRMVEYVLSLWDIVKDTLGYREKHTGPSSGHNELGLLQSLRQVEMLT